MNKEIVALLDASVERLAGVAASSKARAKQQREDAQNAAEVARQLETQALGVVLPMFEHAKQKLEHAGFNPEVAQRGGDVNVEGNTANAILRLEFDHPTVDDEHVDSPLRAAVVACVENHKLHIVSTVDVGAANGAFTRHNSWVIGAIAERHHRDIALAVKKALDAIGR